MSPDPNPYASGLISNLGGRKEKSPTEWEIAAWEKDLADAESAFLKLLDSDEIRCFRTEAAPFLYERNHSGQEERKFDLAATKRWIAKRAYNYGWTKKRFGSDRDQMGRHSRDRPRVERIGKKYQWLALDELLSRMADNYWMEGEFGQLPKSYASPLDVGFERNIDPTILVEAANHGDVFETKNSWAFVPQIKLDEIDEAKLPTWPFRQDPASELKAMPVRHDADGADWLVLYEHQSRTEKYPGELTASHGMRMQQFRFLATVIVKSYDAKAIASHFCSKGEIDVMHWGTSDMTDAAFLFEAPWRKTWPDRKWLFDSWQLPSGIEYAQLVTRYRWESHLDAALPEGYSSHLPTAWVAQELNLKADKKISGLWREDQDEIVFQEFTGKEGGEIALLRMDAAQRLAGDHTTFLSVLISERNVWPGGNNKNAAWRRSEGVCWRSGRGIEAKIWKRDNGNGSSAKYVPKS